MYHEVAELEGGRIFGGVRVVKGTVTLVEDERLMVPRQKGVKVAH